MSNKESTTMIDVKRGRELLAEATEPGKPWSTSHRADGTASIYTSGPGPLRGIIDVAETRSNDADLTVWLHNNAEALLSAAERVDGAESTADDSRAALEMETIRREALQAAISNMDYPEEVVAEKANGACADCGNLPCSDDCNLVRLAAKLKAGAAAERRVAELEAKNAQLAHEGDVLGALYVGDAPPKDAARAIVERAQAAERARDEALAKLTALEAEARADKALIKRITVICDDCPGEGHCEFCNDAGVVPHDARLQRELEAVVDAFPDDLGDDEPWTPSQGMRAVVAARDEALQRAEAAEKSASKIAIEAIEAAAKLSLATGGTSACPICGIDQVHAHTKEDVEAWVTRQVARWGYIASLGPTPPRAQVETELVQTLEELRSRGPACPSCGSHGACNESCAIELALRLFYERDPQGRVDG